MNLREETNGISVRGIKVGHAQDFRALTGCTVILCEEGAVCGIDKRGGGTTTRQADAFEPWHVVERVYGVLLTGGSAFGLGALSGVLEYLEEREIGFQMRVARVPIVAAAGLFDLGIGDATVRPDPEMAYQACLVASDNEPDEGCYGAGTGATVGKILGNEYAMKSGFGRSALSLANGLLIEAYVAVNAGGDVVDPHEGRIIAGVRSPAAGSANSRSTYFANAINAFKYVVEQHPLSGVGENTVIGVITTNAKLNKVEASKVAQMAHDGLARAVRPAHTMYDGDTIFTLATGEISADVSLVGTLAAEVFADAIVRGVQKAVSMGGLPAAGDVPYT